jgi:hypothetical protein
MKNSNSMLIQCLADVSFGDLRMNQCWNYYLNGKNLENGSIIKKGDNLVRIKGKLLGEESQMKK